MISATPYVQSNLNPLSSSLVWKIKIFSNYSKQKTQCQVLTRKKFRLTFLNFPTQNIKINNFSSKMKKIWFPTRSSKMIKFLTQNWSEFCSQKFHSAIKCSFWKKYLGERILHLLKNLKFSCEFLDKLQNI